MICLPDPLELVAQPPQQGGVVEGVSSKPEAPGSPASCKFTLFPFYKPILNLVCVCVFFFINSFFCC